MKRVQFCQFFDSWQEGAKRCKVKSYKRGYSMYKSVTQGKRELL